MSSQCSAPQFVLLLPFVIFVIASRATAAPVAASASSSAGSSEDSGAGSLLASRVASAGEAEAVTLLSECDPEGLLLNNAGVFEVRGGLALDTTGREEDASSPAPVRPCPIQLLAPDAMRVRLTFIASSFSCADTTESYFYVSNAFVLGERVFTPNGLRAALAARLTVPCELPASDASASGSAVSDDGGRVWISDGNVGQIMHTLYSSSGPMATASPFVRFRLDFLPHPSPCNVFAWEHSGRLQLTLPPGRSSCTFVHLNPIRFQLGFLSVPASTSADVAAPAARSSGTRARALSMSPSGAGASASEAAEARSQGASLSSSSHELNIDRVFAEEQRRERDQRERLIAQAQAVVQRAFDDEENEDALRRPQSLLEGFERLQSLQTSASSELELRRRGLVELENMCEAVQSETFVEILEQPFGELVRRHRLCGRSDTPPARSKLRFRTSCAGDATSVRIVRRSAASSLATAALLSAPITSASSAAAGASQSASASAPVRPASAGVAAPTATARLTIRYEEEEETAREARCGATGEAADGEPLPIAPVGSGSVSGSGSAHAFSSSS